MRKESFYYKDATLYERATLTQARRRYEAGETIILAPVNAAMFHGPNSLWIDVNKAWTQYKEKTFKSVVSSFEYYNLHRGAGNYTKFFVKR